MKPKNSDSKFSTEQEAFWAGQFGSDYISRNSEPELLASNLNFFTSALKSASKINSCIEFGANIGLNLRALKLLFPKMEQCAVEINPDAAFQLRQWMEDEQVFCGPLNDYQPTAKFDLVLFKGVLIHIHPDHLRQVYEKAFAASGRYILFCEYYNPSPVMIPYRGHSDRLFKRDFCGEMLERFPELELRDYGFAYHRDESFPQDDINWFLMEKHE